MTSYTKDDLTKALSAFKNHEYSSLRACSDAIKIPKSTLQDRLSGKQDRIMAHERQQALSIIEEHVLLDWIKRLADLGNPITLALTRDLAFET